jgi:hypothetical protein
MKYDAVMTDTDGSLSLNLDGSSPKIDKAAPCASP